MPAPYPLLIPRAITVVAWERPVPKTDNGRRTIRLARMAIEALRRQRVRQLEERLALGRSGGTMGSSLPAQAASRCAATMSPNGCISLCSNG